MLLVSEEAIYVYEYLALMNEPAQDYLDNMLNYIQSNLNVYVPKCLLGLESLYQNRQCPIESLFRKILLSKTGDHGSNLK